MAFCLVAGVLGGLLIAGSAAPGAEPEPSPATPSPDSLVTGRVTYVVGTTAYIDVGSEMGLSEGAGGDLTREGRVIGQVRVTYLSSRRASCTVTAPDTAPLVGDVVRIRLASPPGAAIAVVPVPEDAPAQAVSGRGWLRQAGLRGRLGLRYLAVHDRSDLGDHFSQPAVDLNLRGTGVGGSPFDLFADVRARRTQRSLGADDGRTRVYLLGAGWNPSSRGPRVFLGRQLSAELPSIGVFDGARAEYAWSRLSLGGFAGAQPDPVDYSVSNDIMELGFYSQIHGESAARTRWRASGGYITSTAKGEPNRDFLFLQGQLQASAIWFYGSQEVDLNRGWKADAEGTSLTWTNSFATLRWQLLRSLALRSSFDNRRNVRLYRDKDTPESDFDDGYRQGFAAGGEWRPGRTWGIDLGYRSSRGEHGDALSYTAVLRAMRLPPGALDGSLRVTHYDGPEITGWLEALSLTWRTGWRLDIELHGGLRSEDRTAGVDAHEDLSWVGTDIDLGLWGGWYLLLSAEATRGSAEKTDQGYASLTYRF